VLSVVPHEPNAIIALPFSLSSASDLPGRQPSPEMSPRKSRVCSRDSFADHDGVDLWHANGRSLARLRGRRRQCLRASHTSPEWAPDPCCYNLPGPLSEYWMALTHDKRQRAATGPHELASSSRRTTQDSVIRSNPGDVWDIPGSGRHASAPTFLSHTPPCGRPATLHHRCLKASILQQREESECITSGG
jgi:hypothetical protein